MRAVILSSIMALLVSGCAAPAFQPFQSKIDKTISNITDIEKQELLNSFIKNNAGTAIYKKYNVENSCLEYNYKNRDSDYKYKYCYVVQDNIINKKDASLCKTLNTNTGKWWDHDKCSSILKEQNEFHEYVQQIDNKISIDFDPYLVKMKDAVLEMKNNIANGDKAFDNNDFEKALQYYKKACDVGSEKGCKGAKYMERKRIEQEKELKEKAEKYLEAANKLKKIEQSRERKGQHVMTFLESCSYRAYGYKDLGGRYQHISEQAAEKMCRETCSQYVFNNSGYDNLQEALNDGWKFKAKAKESKEQINEYCVCEGNSYVLEK